MLQKKVEKVEEGQLDYYKTLTMFLLSSAKCQFYFGFSEKCFLFLTNTCHLRDVCKKGNNKLKKNNKKNIKWSKMSSSWYTFGTVDFINVTLLLKIFSLEFFKNKTDGHGRWRAIGFFHKTSPVPMEWSSLKWFLTLILSYTWRHSRCYVTSAWLFFFIWHILYIPGMRVIAR